MAISILHRGLALGGVFASWLPRAPQRGHRRRAGRRAAADPVARAVGGGGSVGSVLWGGWKATEVVAFMVFLRDFLVIC